MFKKIWNWFKNLFESEVNEIKVPETPVNIPQIPDPRPTTNSYTLAQLMPFSIFHFESLKELKAYIEANPHIKLVNLELDQMSKEACNYLLSKNIKICAYISASYEEWREDSKDYPKSAKGKKMSGWDELWGNICDPALQEFLAKRFDKAKLLGCHFVEVDNVDVALNEVGFSVNKKQNVDAIRKLASIAHSKGLGYFLKNTPDLAKDLVSFVEGAFVEEAQEYEETDKYASFVSAHKPLFGLEYGKAKGLRGWYVHSQSDYFDKSYKAYYTGY